MSYAQKLHALGRMLDRRYMRDVCIAELEEGFLVSGVGRVVRGEGVTIEPITFQVERRKLPASGGPESNKRRWPW